MITTETVVAALKATGPIAPGLLATKLKISMAGLKYHLKKMLDAGQLKAAGKTTGRLVGLPDQDFGNAQVPTRSERRDAKKGNRKATTPAASPTPEPTTATFTPAITADNRLVLINGDKPAQIIDAASTAEIATLIFANFEA